MPYIDKEKRKEIYFEMDNDGVIENHVMVEAIETPGDFNYAVTEMMINYLNRKGISYTNMNELVGMLECAKLELYRRMTAPYEDHKIFENGDVYGENVE